MIRFLAVAAVAAYFVLEAEGCGFGGGCGGGCGGCAPPPCGGCGGGCGRKKREVSETASSANGAPKAHTLNKPRQVVSSSIRKAPARKEPAYVLEEGSNNECYQAAYVRVRRPRDVAMLIEQGEDAKVVVPHLKTAETAPCPQEEWLQVIKSNIGSDASSSVYAIQSALYRKYETKFLVTCAPKGGDSLPQFVTNGDGYCATSSETLWCQAFALVA